MTDPQAFPIYGRDGRVLYITVTARIPGGETSVQYTPAELLAQAEKVAALERRAEAASTAAAIAQAQTARVTAERDALRAVVKRMARQRVEDRMHYKEG